jgi:hypothetical protein
MTDVLLRPESDLLMRTFPGAADNARFDVIVTTTTVEMLLSLNALL